MRKTLFPIYELVGVKTSADVRRLFDQLNLRGVAPRTINDRAADSWVHSARAIPAWAQVSLILHTKRLEDELYSLPGYDRWGNKV